MTEDGPRVGAFFDFDGTLLDGFSAFAFLRDRAERSDLPLGEALRLVRTGVDASRGRTDFDVFMRMGCEPFRGQDEAGLAELGERLYSSRLKAALYPEAVAIVAGHRARGHTVVLATSALPFQVEPAAREMGVEHILCTRLEARDGVCTGRVAGPIIWGHGKADAVRDFAARHDIDLAASFGYGNGDEDEEFLRAVGRPHPINPKPELARIAQAEGWPVQRFELRREPGTGAALRTVVSAGLGAAGAGLRLGRGLLRTGARLSSGAPE